jgi:putative colanic acid biosynthesis UDP-glucose lipid carrier transferase
MERYTNTSRYILPILDTGIILGAFHLAAYSITGIACLQKDQPLFLAIFVLLWIILSRQYANLYRQDRLLTYGEKLVLLVGAFALHAALLQLGNWLLGVQLTNIPFVKAAYGFAVAGVVVERLVLAFGYRTYQRYVAHARNRFVIVGTSAGGQQLYHLLTNREQGHSEFGGFFTEEEETVPANLRTLVRGLVDELQTYCRTNRVDELYFALPFDRQRLLRELASFAADNFISFRIVPDYASAVGHDVNVCLYDRLPILTVRSEPLGIHANQMLKRAFDVVFSLVVICGIFPFLLPLLAVLIRLDSPGPIFFTQMRPGLRNQLFPCYKLRTMRTSHQQTELQATKADPRVTRVGRFLRENSLDELPQFFNVLLGHMSVVGPRPNMVSQLEEYSKHIRSYPLRHAVMPGITGYAQVNGCRGETRVAQAMEKRVAYDLKYLEDWSFGLDLQIIGQTVRNMIRGEKNAY